MASLGAAIRDVADAPDALADLDRDGQATHNMVMSLWKMPPRAKVYEALSAVVDGRVRLVGEGEAEVSSSAGDKVYRVKWDLAAGEITSTDPASRFQGYVGYPIIAVLLATGWLRFDRSRAEALGGVPWKVLNDTFKRDYDAAVAHVVAERNLQVDSMIEEIYADLEGLQLRRPLAKKR